MILLLGVGGSLLKWEPVLLDEEEGFVKCLLRGLLFSILKFLNVLHQMCFHVETFGHLTESSKLQLLVVKERKLKFRR